MSDQDSYNPMGRLSASGVWLLSLKWKLVHLHEKEEGSFMDTYEVKATAAGWELVKPGSARPFKFARTKELMLSALAEFMKGKIASVRIRKKDGTIEEERRYPRSADPIRSKG